MSDPNEVRKAFFDDVMGKVKAAAGNLLGNEKMATKGQVQRERAVAEQRVEAEYERGEAVAEQRRDQRESLIEAEQRDALEDRAEALSQAQKDRERAERARAEARMLDDNAPKA